MDPPYMRHSEYVGRELAVRVKQRLYKCVVVAFLPADENGPAPRKSQTPRCRINSKCAPD